MAGEFRAKSTWLQGNFSPEGPDICHLSRTESLGKSLELVITQLGVCAFHICFPEGCKFRNHRNIVEDLLAYCCWHFEICCAPDNMCHHTRPVKS